MFLRPKTYLGGFHMTQVHFTLKTEDIQSLIEESVEDNASKLVLQTLFNQLMEQQRTEYIKAESYERNSKRTTQRNGYFERNYTTRIGTLELRVPRTRDGEFSPDIFERYQRNEKALVGSMLEMYIAGVSTRKVSRIVEELCGKSVSKSFVSSLTSQLDPLVKEWQERDLSNKKYPYLMTDVIYIDVRENGKVISKSCHIAVGVSEKGTREILGFMIQGGESEDSWTVFFDYLKQRGLTGIKMIISDAHKGLVKAIKKSFTNVTWQRWQVHFIRNILKNVPKTGSEDFKNSVKAIFKFKDMSLARQAKNALIEKYETNAKYKKACKTFDEGFEDSFQYLVVANGHNRLKSTNMLERLNQEVRRREKVIRIFPNTPSANRLIGALLMDKNEEWAHSSRTYIKPDHL
jgi:transposase-like protein